MVAVAVVRVAVALPPPSAPAIVSMLAMPSMSASFRPIAWAISVSRNSPNSPLLLLPHKLRLVRLVPVSWQPKPPTLLAPVSSAVLMRSKRLGLYGPELALGRALGPQPQPGLGIRLVAALKLEVKLRLRPLPPRPLFVGVPFVVLFGLLVRSLPWLLRLAGPVKPHSLID